MRYIAIESCGSCPSHCNATFKGWWNHYCEENTRSITEEECESFPDWCPLNDKEGK